jgi:predicted deacylase
LSRIVSDVHLVQHLEVTHVPAGCRHAFDLQGLSSTGEAPPKIPVKIVCGSEPGPCLVAIAGIHGDEAEGIFALTEFWDELPPHFRGRIILVPVANPAAFEAGARRSPSDRLDLNRSFPGNVKGSPTERLAHLIFSKVVAHADFLCTLHSWFATGTTLPFVEVWADPSSLAERGYQAALASGFERIRLTTWPDGLLVRIANEAGIPGIEMEVGDSGRSRPENRWIYKAHLTALMQHLGMLDGTPSPHPDARRYDGRHVFCERGGVLRVHTALGAPVNAGDVLGTVYDLHGETIEEIQAPKAGIVAAHREYASASPGDLICTLFSQRQ